MFAKKKIKIQEIAQVSLHGYQLNYQVTYSKRRSISVKIHQGKQVLVSAPLSLKKAGVEKFLIQKSDWIIEKLQKQNDHIDITSSKNFVDGEQLYFLGNKYTLKTKRDLVPDITLGAAEIIVSNPSTKTPAKIKTQLKNWYKLQIEQIFNERLDECLKLTKQIGISYSNNIQPRKMNRRWGTCTHKNQIILNSNLIFLGLEYIDYVILHELCHFKEKNHSLRYYSLLKSVCPNYKDVRKRLNQHNIDSFL